MGSARVSSAWSSSTRFLLQLVLESPVVSGVIAVFVSLQVVLVALAELAPDVLAALVTSEAPRSALADAFEG